MVRYAIVIDHFPFVREEEQNTTTDAGLVSYSRSHSPYLFESASGIISEIEEIRLFAGFHLVGSGQEAYPPSQYPSLLPLQHFLIQSRGGRRE